MAKDVRFELRLSEELLGRIDAARGRLSRAAFIRMFAEQACDLMEQHEREAA